MMTETATTSTTYDPSTRIISQVKFFNDISHYGFLSPLSSKGVDRISAPDDADIFVHVGQIRPLVNTENPTLYTGEYVEHGITSDEDGRVQAIAVTGINGGSLMCDHGVISFKNYFKRQFENPRGVKRKATTSRNTGGPAEAPTYHPPPPTPVDMTAFVNGC